ncbi:unnamed protein product [Vicia faba]|uniref:Uncharacterized protein n=1 Tax=Vicia faba TaxID=3906 RepID=A0AAV0ZQ11_VICFA|nr:unnamed protein product [Vicia faba]
MRNFAFCCRARVQLGVTPQRLVKFRIQVLLLRKGGLSAPYDTVSIIGLHPSVLSLVFIYHLCEPSQLISFNAFVKMQWMHTTFIATVMDAETKPWLTCQNDERSTRNTFSFLL